MRETKEELPMMVLKASHVTLPSEAEAIKKIILESMNERVKRDLGYAKVRWEFLRRNEKLRLDYESFDSISQKTLWRIYAKEDWALGGNKEGKVLVKFINKWSLRPYLCDGSAIYLFNIELSLDEQIDWLCCLEKERKDWGWDDCYRDALYGFMASTLNMKDIENSCIDIIDFRSPPEKTLFHPYRPPSRFPNNTPDTLKQGLIPIRIDITYSKAELVRTLEILIDEYKPYIGPIKKKKKARSKHRYNLYPLYLRVYDMREKDGMTYRAIAEKFISEEIFTDDLTKDPRGSEIKVMQHYKEAKRIIDNVADF